MADKLPIDLPPGTPGIKIAHAVNTDDTTDTPQGTSQQVQVADVSAVDDTFIPLLSDEALISSSLSESVSTVTSTKPITAPSITVLPGTVNVGNQALKSAGENFTFTNTADEATFEPIWIKQSDNVAKARFALGSLLNTDVETSKADILINPVWTYTTLGDQRLTSVTFETDTTITNVILTINRDSEKFYQAELGTLTANVETTIELHATTGNVPVDLFDATLYDYALASPDGDVSAKGSIANSLPFFSYEYYDFFDYLSVTELDYAIESVSASLIYGCQPSIATPTTIDIAAGVVRTVSLDAQNVPTVNTIPVGPFFGVAVPNLLTEATTVVTLDSNQLPVLTSSIITDSEIRTSTITGQLVHTTGTLEFAFPLSVVASNTYSQFVSVLLKLGTFRSGNLAIVPNADLTIDKIAGFLTSVGAGNAFGYADENTTTIAPAAPAPFRRYLGATGTLITETLSTTLVDPGFYDDGSGTKQPVPGSVKSATNQFIFQLPVPGGGLNIAYGQTVYPTLQDAITNAPIEPHVVPQAIGRQANLLAVLSVTSACIDLTNIAEASFSAGPKFGVERGGALGSSGSGGGDFIGPASSDVDEIVTFADTTGKTGSSASNIKALSGVLSGIGSALKAESYEFPAGGVNFLLPAVDANAGNVLTTDGAGLLTFQTPSSTVITTIVQGVIPNSAFQLDTYLGAPLAYVAPDREIISVYATLGIPDTGVQGFVELFIDGISVTASVPISPTAGVLTLLNQSPPADFLGFGKTYEISYIYQVGTNGDAQNLIFYIELK